MHIDPNYFFQLHPDTNKTKKGPEHHKNFVELIEAYEVLSKPQERARYDQKLNSARPRPMPPPPRPCDIPRQKPDIEEINKILSEFNKEEFQRHAIIINAIFVNIAIVFVLHTIYINSRHDGAMKEEINYYAIW